MSRFRFGLDAVLEQRKREERAAQVAVAEIERERLRLEDEIRACDRSIRAEKSELTERLASEREGGAVDIGSVRLQANASLNLIASAQRRVVVLAGVHARLDKARLALLEASVRRKALERLRERAIEAHLRDEARAERAEEDELSVMRQGRKRGVA